MLCFEVTEGKTKSAARIIPVHSMIKPLVLSLREKPYNGFYSTVRQSLTVQTASAQRGIHSVSQGLNARL